MSNDLSIVELTPDLVPDICQVYNEGIAAVPHCYPVSEAWFTEELTAALGQPDENNPLQNQKIFVAVKASRAVGFIHVAHDLKNPDISTWGILFLMYRPGDRATGNALIEHANQYFETEPADRILAFHQAYRYNFYHRGAAFLSDRLGHIQALLQSHGYERVAGEVYMDWDNYQLVDLNTPNLPIRVDSETLPGRGILPNLKNYAVLNGERIGTCSIVSCGSYADQDVVQNRLFVVGLYIDDPYQGQGLGAYLLQKTLNDAYEIGYRHAAISTAMHNARAFVFYTNYGFSVSDWTYGWVQRLTP